MLIFKRLSSTLNQKLIYFGNNSLNRVSFLRKDPIFIANALTSPYTRLVFFNNTDPLVNTTTNTLYESDYTRLGPEFSDLLDNWVQYNRENSIQLQTSPVIHFLGLSTIHHSPFRYKSYTGIPYFAIDISNQPKILSKITSTPDIKQLSTRESISEHLDNHDASMFAQGKMYLDWISRTKHCIGCGSPTIPVNAGSELACLSDDKCPVKEAPVSNASFPRIDPVLITCVIKGDHILFTRNSKFPKGMYTCIAGFIEPGESIENAVRREVWEESGIVVESVKIVQSQPWPFPANIMIGCVAFAKDDTELELGHDYELQDAMWIHKEKVKDLVHNGVENDDLVMFVDKFDYGIPNQKTLAFQLYKYAVDHLH